MKKKVLSLLLALLVCVSGVACAATYTADGQGMMGAVTVTVDYADGKINAVTVDAHNETAGISDPAIARIPAEIVEKQSIAVDTVAGATMTSKGILTAVEAALTAAGADVESFKVAAEAGKIVQGATEKTDIVIVGGGLAGLMAAYELKDTYPEVDYILIDKLDVVTGSLPTTGAPSLPPPPSCTAPTITSAPRRTLSTCSPTPPAPPSMTRWCTMCTPSPTSCWTA